jgi:hypothetical protein
VFNLYGVKITKLFDALTRSLLGVTKTSIVWVIGIVITWIGKDNKALHIESLNLGVNLMKGAGFCFIIVGTLAYNGLIWKRYLEPEHINEETEFKVMVEEKIDKT